MVTSLYQIKVSNVKVWVYIKYQGHIGTGAQFKMSNDLVFIGGLSSTDIENTFNLSLYPDIMCIELVEVNLMACCLKSHTLHQYASLKGTLTSALHKILLELGMIHLLIQDEVENLSL